MAADAEAMSETGALSGALAAAFNRRDVVAMAAMFADDATLLPPGTRMIKGRQNIATFWSNTAERMNEISFLATDIKLLGGDAAREIGRITMKFAGQSPQELTSKYLLIWQKAGAEWKAESIIWNRISSPQPGRARQTAGGARNRPGRGQGGYGQMSTLYSR